MKSLVLSTSSNETTKYSEGLRDCGYGEVRLMAYDQPGHTEQALYAKAKEYAPDFIVYIGARFGQQPSISMLAKINSSIAPMVHICSDAADNPWWDLLRDYNERGAFTLQVAIDGSHKWPLASTQMTALTPVDPKNFPAFRPHADRATVAGYAGNPGSGPGSRRTAVLASLLEARLIGLRIRSNLPYTYESYCEYLSGIRISLNIAYSGTEATTHVKGRVLESGLAGCALLETAGSPTSAWFRPGLDYLEYTDEAHAANIIRMLAHEPEATDAMGRSLMERVAREHSPAAFWGRILERIGMRGKDCAAVLTAGAVAHYAK